MSKLILPRRTFLKGVGGVAVALPLLEVMTGGVRSSFAADPPPAPKRYVVCFNGQSMGADNDPVHDLYVPNKVGQGYDLKDAVAPFKEYGVEDEVTIVSGLRIPTAADNGGSVPAGGRSDNFHSTTLSPLFSGMRAKNGNAVQGTSSDQIVANAIAGSTTFPSLVYRVQAAWYLSSGTPSGKDMMSYKAAAQGIPAQVSPKAAFDSLFYGFDVPTDPGQSAEADFAHRTRASVIDLVRDNTERLVGRLGGADRRRMEQHLDELRDLEKRINALPPEVGGSCKLPTDPGADPPLGGAQQVGAGEVVNYNTSNGYSGEKERAIVFCDLIQMAFACDLSRVSSLMITYAQSHLNMFPITGLKGDVHDITHNGVPGGTASVAKVMAWHMSVFAYLVAKLRDTPEGGGSLLDSCALVMLHEGGHGYDPASGKQYGSHSSENMACSIAGGAGGLKRGHHVVAKDKHPGNVLVTLMNAVGVPDGQLGEVKGALPELLG